MKKNFLHTASILAVSLIAFALPAAAQQGTSKYIRQGNAQYKKQQYADAEASYKKALERDARSVEGNFNLGNSLYEQKRYDAARQQYANTLKTPSKKENQGDANYNIGNTFMEDKKWEESIAAYKKALKANPADEQARYNLAYAQEMLKKQQQNQGGGKDNKEQKDKDKQQKDNKDEHNKDKKDKQDKQDQQDDQKDQKEQNQQPKPKPSKLSQEEAKRLLQALAQQEKKLQEDKLKKTKGTPVSVEKDW